MMKRTKRKPVFWLFIALFPLWGLGGCEKNDDDAPPPNPVDLLPPATQTGENTFGCLLDGEAFLPSALPNSFNCFYQFVEGEYLFTIRGSKRDSNGNYITIGIKTEKKQIQEGRTYNLHEVAEGNVYGVYFYNLNFNYTSHTYTGELTITKLDFENQIVSGTFWFDVKDENGIVHEIREGRFDMHFTQ